MIKRIIEYWFKYRKWFFFIACIFTLIAVLFLHGSVYRYVNIINGVKKLPKDARAIGIYYIYIWVASISLFTLIFAGIPYFFCKNITSKAERLTYSIIIVLLILLISVSLFVLGVFYV